jgi:hypothetical protein
MLIALPLIPHCDMDPECCGCLMQVMGEDGIYFRCNECGAVLTKGRGRAAPLILSMESCEATCLHCGKVNEVTGFSEVFAFVYRFCGQGVTV